MRNRSDHAEVTVLLKISIIILANFPKKARKLLKSYSNITQNLPEKFGLMWFCVGCLTWNGQIARLFGPCIAGKHINRFSFRLCFKGMSRRDLGIAAKTTGCAHGFGYLLSRLSRVIGNFAKVIAERWMDQAAMKGSCLARNTCLKAIGCALPSQKRCRCRSCAQNTDASAKSDAAAHKCAA